MTYKRKIFDQINFYLESPLAIVITGMRRVGKTTLLKYIFEKISSDNKLFIDLENPLNQLIFSETNYEIIKKTLEKRGLDFKKKTYLFLDEIQHQKNIPSVVKYFIDHYQVKFFLTGSASFYLKNLFSESLAGRKIIFELFPLDFEEFLIFKESQLKKPYFNDNVNESTYLLFQPYVDEYLAFGGFPEVVLAQNKEEKEKILADIFTSYFQIEIKQFSDFKKTDLIRDLIIILAQNNGNLLNVERIANDLRVSRITVEEWLYYLKNTYFIDFLSSFSKSERVVIKKAKKIYFIDWGLANIITPQTEGQILENCCYHLLKLKGKIYYYRKKSGVEIDFILKEKDQLFAFEVKKSFNKRYLSNLERLSQNLLIKERYLLLKKYFENKKVRFIFNL